MLLRGSLIYRVIRVRYRIMSINDRKQGEHQIKIKIKKGGGKVAESA